MSRTAVIDIGSNSVRLLWGEEKGLEKKYVATTQLSQGLDATGALCSEAMERTLRAVEGFCAQARADGAREILIFATEAVRAASNRAVFVDAVRTRTGLAVDVLDGPTEATCGYLGVAGVTDERVTVLDIGGASMELVVGEGGCVRYRKSLPLGVVRLTERYGNAFEELCEGVAARLSEYGTVPQSDKLVAIGGTALTLASMLDGQTAYDPSRTHGYRLTEDALRRLFRTLAPLTAEELVAQFPTVPLKRAQTVRQGLVALQCVMQYLGATECITSEADNLEGYLALRNR